MVKEAEANKEADSKRKDLTDAKNDGEQLIFATEKAVKDLGDKVDSKDKNKAEDLIKDLRKALEGDNLDEINKAKDALNEVAMSLSTKVYEEASKKAQAEQANNTSESNEEKKDSNVKDAEYEEK